MVTFEVSGGKSWINYDTVLKVHSPKHENEAMTLHSDVRLN